MAAKIEWRESEEGLFPYYVDGRWEERAEWAPQPGSQQAFLECPVYEALGEGTRGGGKALVHGEPVLTVQGWVPIQQITLGMSLVGPDGSSARVTGVFPQGARECVRLTFSDGTHSDCDLDHRWAGHVQGLRGRDRVFSTREIIDRLEQGQRVHIKMIYGELSWGCPELPVDPYLLGLLLGDGSFPLSGDVGFTTVDQELVDVLVHHGFNEVASDPRNGVRQLRLSRKCRLWSDLSSLGLLRHRSWEKFIPEVYMNAMYSERLALLQGLLDTDGNARRGGSSAQFSSASPQLASDLASVARSLGARVTQSVRHTTHRDAHRLNIQPGNRFECFRLSRKQSVMRPHMHSTLTKRVVSVQSLGLKQATCIAVDHPSRTYITRDFTVTHNTDVLLMDFAQDVGQGWGEEWRGILFRRTYPELEDVIIKSKKWFSRIFPEAVYNEAKSFWKWPGGERLYFRQFSKPDDYWKYHGHAYPWIGWEELTTWANDECFKTMFSCSRSPVKGIPLRIRSTTNPYGVGHHWVKERYRLPVAPGRIIGPIVRDSVDEAGNTEPPRVAIHSHLRENRVLLTADPNYIQRISAAARNESERKAWLEGSWDIVSGGMFDDVWDPEIHLVPEFEIPRGWRIDRSFDWGSSRPFSVGWWVEADGSDLTLSNGRVIHTNPGDLFRVAEWYGWTGKPNKGLYMTAREIAVGIRERETDLFGKRRVNSGPADTSIFDTQNGNSIARDMRSVGVHWTRADKSAGSRKNGWERVRNMLKATAVPETGVPALYIVDTCDQFIRTVPTLPRLDRDLDDVDTNAEDHIGDEVRYRVYRGSSRLLNRRVRGR